MGALSTSFRWLFAVVASMALVAVGSGEAAAIQDGLPVAGIGMAEQEDTGSVTLSWQQPFNPANPLFVLPVLSCSGVLIANDWLLSAGHCASDMGRTPNGLNVQIASDPNPTVADAIYLFGGFSDEVGPDLSLIHLQRPLLVHGSTAGLQRPFWTGTMAQLAQGVRTVSIYGQGNNTRTAPPPGGNPCSDNLLTGAGVYRAGTAQINTVGLEDPGHRTSQWTGQGNPVAVPGGRLFSLKFAPSRTQISIRGDSGGGTFIFNPPDPTPYLVGIHSGGGGCNPATAKNQSSYDVGIPAVHDWIAAVLTSTWEAPSTTAYQLPIRTAELDGVGRPVGDLDSVGWAQAARAAAAVCVNRGAVGGHLVGHQDAQAKIVHCSGGDTVWFDVNQQELDATNQGFTNINTVDWRQAARAAMAVCVNKNMGFVAGQFNGQERDGMRGVFCYRGGAQYIDATDQQITDTGWPLPTYHIDWLPGPWAQAARAANEFCRNNHYGVGGFMSGHYLPNKVGVVCQQ
ncbi:trypsin-like serine protease [Mycobacterium sp. NPDC048908]|uniref:trypsin-like serine protease n=1 Tax=Mycobacterium sp. NPDC048908 TaxID=3364292 RepID=UPI00371E3C9A